MILIAAMSRDRIIGAGDGLPWDVPEEYAQFLAFIRGETVLIGRRSFEIFGKDLTSAHTVVLSRRRATIPGARVASSWEEACALATSFGRTVFCAGGESVYRLALPSADAMYLSILRGRFEGDARFPTFSEALWRVETRTEHPRFEFVVYRRIAGNEEGGAGGGGDAAAAE
jgi:dihydrofolate reductase